MADNHDAAAWNGELAQRWVKNADKMDALMADIATRLIELAGLSPGERVLDIGCGAGVTTMMAADRVGTGGAARGVDVSTPMVEHARKRAAQAGSSAVFEVADAAAWSADAPYDIAVSRFGVMFFDDLTAAFSNIRASLKPEGRTAFICWREPRQNELFALPNVLIQPFLKRAPEPSDPDAPGPFALADAGKLLRVMEKSGWRDIDIMPVDFELTPPGDTAAEQVDELLEMGPGGRILREQEIDVAPVAAAFRDYFADRLDANGLFSLHAGAWAVKARA